MMPGVVAGFTRPVVAPSAPLNFQQTGAGRDPLLYYTFAWQAPQAGSPPSGYRVYMKSGTGSYVLQAQTTNTSVRVDGVSDGVTQYFYVTAWNSAGESPASNVLTFLPS
ncbi:fibronectin type III domain-containing protein [Stutzerimonas stutzeri]|uniref:fibronectin type III domain-containing protein n=1 Tax=Stutzerimonas stutzeri TaxID=316 RepID=UPI00244D763A|nr:fibronectin type III domain-containing protein [Stutzerimonas stutzeri]MDH0082746.1 fibronectin type III domain-containing protein [Stutzerimonas stutzeri]